MTNERLFENITTFPTPVGTFSISSGDEKVAFSVAKNDIDWPYEVTDADGNIVGLIHTDTNYQIEIDVNQLQIGKIYTIQFTSDESCHWELCGSGEHTICFSTIIGNWIVGIGAYDPNDIEKDQQAWEAAEKNGDLKKGFYQQLQVYDESNFIQYTVEELDTCDGFRFKLFDYSCDKVHFEVAWIEIGEYPIANYECAMELWLS